MFYRKRVVVLAEKRYLIATACNKKYEDFLLNHWFRSLKDNVNLSETDVLIMDYGLSEDIVQKLSEQGAIVLEATKRDDLINNARFFELAVFLKQNPNYEKVAITDSGDLIFQSDISDLFKINCKIAGVLEEISPAIVVLIKRESIRNYDELINVLKNKKLINVGFLIGSRDFFLEVADEMLRVTKVSNVWGIDTIIPNYIAYKEGFCKLHPKYNFIPTTTVLTYKIKNGKFWFKDVDHLEIIPVVHNAGRRSILRPVLDFGYGEGYNRPKILTILLLRAIYKILRFLTSI